MATSPSSSRTSNRNTELGDRAAVCGSCGWARRYHPSAVAAPTECPSCGDVLITACSACGADLLSVMAVQCDECGEPLRGGVVNGVKIHRPKRAAAVTPPPAPAPELAPAPKPAHPGCDC